MEGSKFRWSESFPRLLPQNILEHSFSEDDFGDFPDITRKFSLLTSREAPWFIRSHHGRGTAFSSSPPPPSRYRLISVRNSDPTKRSELNGTERSAHEQTCITLCEAKTNGCSAKQEMRNVLLSCDISFCGTGINCDRPALYQGQWMVRNFGGGKLSASFTIEYFGTFSEGDFGDFADIIVSEILN
ncbi:hypothetical protein CEXT_476041 [Caerostris extrusa]|uniref:Uncharacterized protein n=1 Tax=Caerostris extrusa TaxID=172846 RepID=A0AAV4U1U0_CAEEX|nr:hypothetical protein CEXT_476041 [Caerostris extrusa]